MASEVGKKLETMPHWFQRYVGECHESIARSNHCEHRPTYQDQLDSETELQIKLYNNGQEWLKTISDEDKSLCTRFYEAENGTTWYPEYVESVIGKRRMLVPLKLRQYDKYLKMKEVFK